MVKQDQKPSDILTRKAFENAIMVNAAIGGSTNFVLHLLAIAGRIGVPLQIEDFDHYSTHIPLMSNLQPSGSYFMEDFYYAGGLPALMAEMQEWLHTEIMTVSGKTVKENIQQSVCYNREVIARGNEPFNPLSGIVVHNMCCRRTWAQTSIFCRGNRVRLLPGIHTNIMSNVKCDRLFRLYPLAFPGQIHAQLPGIALVSKHLQYGFCICFGEKGKIFLVRHRGHTHNGFEFAVKVRDIAVAALITDITDAPVLFH